ncbi:glycine zipper 2TM domain-containing protein [Sphingomonas sp. R1]|uniref:glycine zipper 2TM domain-containing protein n=1 Tax=Sphingomonas sp. R1 TaxID=399176 RepID=UPI0022258E8B|nr:glycine zipper 2TM domain-containing protein [Sphingomonas sp. R1]UYY79114.1 glycine zipper 2TM domain-containing protein [Sphingomonas sp. R1]
MRMLFVAAAAAALTLPTVPAMAQGYGHWQDRDAHWQDRDHGRDRDRDGRWDNRGRGPGDRGDWRRWRNYDYNRPAPGQRRYYADNFYRDGRYYQERRLTRNDRIYRGRDGRYYCRRNDGTTGLIVGGVAGGLFGNALSSGGNATLGTLLGAAAGAALGQSVDRGNVRCR